MKIGTLLLICALALSGTAAYYSIVGLATIFSSAFAAVVVMASILEASKLVVASWLYHNWQRVNGFIRAYLTAAVVILMLITSLGIFGFLSKAHVDQNLNGIDVNLRIEQLDAQIASSRETVQRYRTQLEQLDRSINIQLDANRATQALAARRQQQAERDQIKQRLDAEEARGLDLNQQRTALRQRLSAIETEFGPIRYVAEFFTNGQRPDLDRSVRWMIMVLVLVFDPLAVLMLIAANGSFAAAEQKEPQPAQSPVVAARPDPTLVMMMDRLHDALSNLRVPDQPPKADEIGAAVARELAPILDRAAPAALDAAELRNMVQQSMDEWLTKVSTAPQANTDEHQHSPSDQGDPPDEPVEHPPAAPVDSDADGQDSVSKPAVTQETSAPEMPRTSGRTTSWL